ncbi:hypothetical protein HanPI659440_Chr03g0098511 [Helianthus annuus]|nr:hypothetical protein HanPI659440_Chr03g0098511 [Helianthus annuus]
MSMLWALQNPRVFLVYGYKGKGYSLMNVFDHKAGGPMVVAALPEGRPLRVDQIRDDFLHPSSESMATYANAVLGDDSEDETDIDPAPTREEPILLSSEESAGSYQDLIHHFACAGLQRGAAQEPAERKKEERTEGKTADEPVAETSPSSKSASSGPKIDISKITPPAPPPSRPLDLSPPRLDPKGKDKEGEVEVDQSERVVENVAAGAGKADVHAEGVETEWESSEATPPGTVYTKRLRGSGGGGASGCRKGPEFHRVEGGSWTTHNPACDDLPHAPH